MFSFKTEQDTGAQIVIFLAPNIFIARKKKTAKHLFMTVTFYKHYHTLSLFKYIYVYIFTYIYPLLYLDTHICIQKNDIPSNNS